MKEHFQGIFNLVQQVAPESIKNLNPPASNEGLSKLLSIIPEMTDEMKCLLKIHNGEKAVSWISIFPNGMQLMDIDMILELYEYQISTTDDFIEDVEQKIESNVMPRPIGPVKPVFQYSKRIPFAQINCDLIWYIDMDPAKEGDIGQIIEEDCEDISLRVIAKSLPDLFEMYAKDLQLGIFKADEQGQIFSNGDIWPNK